MLILRAVMDYTVIIVDHGRVVEKFKARLEEVGGDPDWRKPLEYVREKYGPVRSVEYDPDKRTLYYYLG